MIRWKSFLILLLCFPLTGCLAGAGFLAGAAAGVGGYKYYEGKLTVIYQAPFMETWDATLKAFDRMNLKVESSEHNLTSGKIKGKQADNTPVTVSLEYKSAQETEAGIRIGILGDKNASMAVKEEIRKQLFKK